MSSESLRSKPDEQDLESAKESSAAGSDAQSACHDQPSDPNLVAWDGPNDQSNPKNWPGKRRWRVIILVSMFAFVASLSSSMVSPALNFIGDEFHMESEIEKEMALSIFVLGFALGPLLFGPLSEVFGRPRVLQVSNALFIVWNLVCGFARNSAEMFVFRFLAGVGGSAALAIGGGTIGDTCNPDQRAKAIGIYSLSPILGPAIGPIIGGFITEYTTWRWIFWSSSAFAAVVEVVSVIWLEETYTPVLLKAKCARLVAETGNIDLHTGTEAQSLLSHIGTALVRPARLLATQPIGISIALYMAYLFGLQYVITVTFPTVFTQVYGEGVGVGGLHFLSLAVGTTAGVFIMVKGLNRFYRRLVEQNDGVSKPEFRIPAMLIGSVLIPVSLFWFGWSVEGHILWIMPDLGITILAIGAIICVQSMQGYIIDSYTTFAASAIAAITVLRCLAGFLFPLFAPALYKTLGYGWGMSLLAFISIAIGIPAPMLFYFSGPQLRAMSTYVAG